MFLISIIKLFKHDYTNTKYKQMGFPVLSVPDDCYWAYLMTVIERTW
jgi:hypothetical protein